MPKKEKKQEESSRSSSRRHRDSQGDDDDGHGHRSHRRKSKHDRHEEPPPEAVAKPPTPPSKIELLSPKQNGSAAVEADGKEKASIKGMWKKAFKSLKSKDKEKDEKPEKQEKGEGKYSRLQRGASFLGFGGRSHDSSKSQNSQQDQEAHSPEVVQGTEPPQKESRFRRHTKASRVPKTPEADYSRQSSLKRVLKRKDSKEASSDGEPTPEGATGGEVPGDQIDPVYSLLKCAADLPRQQRHATGVGPTGHACCIRSAIGGAASNPDNILTIRGSSRSSSPASEYMEYNSSFNWPISDSGDYLGSSPHRCPCPCHTPEVFTNYHASLINKNDKKKT